MRVRLIDRNNDWTFGLQQSGYTRTATAVALDIKLRLQEWFGDCFFALQNGIAWNVRLGSHNQKSLLDADIQERTMSVPGVVAITGFESVVQDRRYRATFSVMQEYSDEILPIIFTMGV